MRFDGVMCDKTSVKTRKTGQQPHTVKTSKGFTMKLQKAEFSVQQIDGTRVVQGWVCGYFGIYKNAPKDYVVVWLPRGLRINNTVLSYNQARALVRQLVAGGFYFTDATKEQARKVYLQAIRKVVGDE